LKGNLFPQEWRAFMAAHPKWWKEFKTDAEVRRAVWLLPEVVAERRKRASQGEISI